MRIKFCRPAQQPICHQHGPHRAHHGPHGTHIHPGVHHHGPHGRNKVPDYSSTLNGMPAREMRQTMDKLSAQYNSLPKHHPQRTEILRQMEAINNEGWKRSKLSPGRQMKLDLRIQKDRAATAKMSTAQLQVELRRLEAKPRQKEWIKGSGMSKDDIRVGAIKAELLQRGELSSRPQHPHPFHASSYSHHPHSHHFHLQFGR